MNAMGGCFGGVGTMFWAFAQASIVSFRSVAVQPCAAGSVSADAHPRGGCADAPRPAFADC